MQTVKLKSYTTKREKSMTKNKHGKENRNVNHRTIKPLIPRETKEEKDNKKYKKWKKLI